MKSTQGQVAIQAMNMMGYDALTLGYRDLLLGKAVLLERIEQANFAILSANALDGDTSEPLALPYVIEAMDGHTVGIIGLTNDDGPLPAAYDDGGSIKLRNPKEALREYLPQVIEIADVVILLSHLGLEADKELAAEMPEIDVIIGGYSRNLVLPTRYEGLIPIIAQAGYRGEWIGVANLRIDAQGDITSFDGATVALTDEYADDPEMLRFVQQVLD